MVVVEEKLVTAIKGEEDRLLIFRVLEECEMKVREERSFLMREIGLDPIGLCKVVYA